MRAETNETDAPMLGEIVAGFPSPAAQYEEEPLNLNKLLVHRPAATFFLRVAGDSMTGAGIFQDDILVVDRSLTPQDGAIVIACIDGEFTVKYLRISDSCVWLLPANPAYQPIFFQSLQELQIFGVVTATIHQFK